MIPEDALAIGLGGNIGDESTIVERFRRAREALAQLGEIRSAALYRTAPVGPAQPAFLNSAVRVRLAEATPREVIETILEIERLLGRDRRAEARWGPRTIDLDVLLWGTRRQRWEGPPELEVPHPRLVDRRFALRPLLDLFGDDLVIPGTTELARELDRRLTDQAIEEIARAW